MQGVRSIASINLYAEEKDHLLFAYDAPMTLQIHFCLTIKCLASKLMVDCNLALTKLFECLEFSCLLLSLGGCRYSLLDDMFWR